MSGIFNVEQITQGKTLDEWYRPSNHHHEEKTMPERETNGAAPPKRDAILAAFKPNTWLKKAALAAAIGCEPDALTYHLGALIVTKELIAHGNTGTRCFALPGTPAPKGETKAAKTETKVRKPETKPAKRAATAPRPEDKKRMAQLQRDLTPAQSAACDISYQSILTNLRLRRQLLDQAITSIEALA